MLVKVLPNVVLLKLLSPYCDTILKMPSFLFQILDIPSDNDVPTSLDVSSKVVLIVLAFLFVLSITSLSKASVSSKRFETHSSALLCNLSSIFSESDFHLSYSDSAKSSLAFCNSTLIFCRFALASSDESNCIESICFS